MEVTLSWLASVLRRGLALWHATGGRLLRLLFPVFPFWKGHSLPTVRHTVFLSALLSVDHERSPTTPPVDHGWFCLLNVEWPYLISMGNDVQAGVV